MNTATDPGPAQWDLAHAVTVAALPAAEAGAPNVLLIVLDTVSAEAVNLGSVEP
jgi:hypothetical protein